jgi:hypothetical protein
MPRSALSFVGAGLLVVVTVVGVGACSDDSGSGASVPSVCSDGCQQYLECAASDYNSTYSSKSECLADCKSSVEADLANYPAACRSKILSALSCNYGLSCTEVEADDDSSCQSLIDLVNTCVSSSTGGTDTTGDTSCSCSCNCSSCTATSEATCSGGCTCTDVCEQACSGNSACGSYVSSSGSCS